MEAQLREALTLWHQPGTLGDHAMATALSKSLQVQRLNDGLPDNVQGRAQALRAVILSAIQLLRQEGETPPKIEVDDDPRWYDRRWRYYNLLTLLCQHDNSDVEVATRIGLQPGGGQYFREKRAALHALSVILAEGERANTLESSVWPADSSERAQLGIPPGGAMRLTDGRYVERKADVDFQKTAQAIGQTFVIRGARQMGKTSLLRRIANHLQRRFDARLAYVDLQGFDEKHLSSFNTLLYQVLDSIFFELELDSKILHDEWNNNSAFSNKKQVERLLERHVLSRSNTPIIFALDEADRLLPAPYREEFFSMLRVWSNNRAMRPQWEKLHLALVISTEPYLLIRDTHQSPFNVGNWLELDDFDEAQVRQLNQYYGSPAEEADLQHVMTLLGGHPYLTGIAFHTLAHNRMKWQELASANTEKGPFAEHLRHLHRLLNNEPELKSAFAQVIRHRTCKDDIALFRLLKAGLAKRQGEQVICRCGLYTEYFIHRL